jgi:hypothetical protein
MLLQYLLLDLLLNTFGIRVYKGRYCWVRMGFHWIHGSFCVLVFKIPCGSEVCIQARTINPPLCLQTAIIWIS